MRTLVYIPTIHDFRTLDKQYYDKFVWPNVKDNSGIDIVTDKIIPKYWTEIREFVNNYLRENKINKVYSELITEEPSSRQKIQEVAESKNAHTEIINYLVKKGAILMQTEKSFLKRLMTHESILITMNREKGLLYLEEGIRSTEYTLLQEITNGEEKIIPMKLRDEFIAEKINSTLQNNETGILFLGAAHEADKYIRQLDNNLNIIHFNSPNLNELLNSAKGPLDKLINQESL